MHPALLGTIAALSWGVADFIARFASRAVGPVNAAFAAAAISFLGQSALVYFAGYALVWNGGGIWLVVVNGVAVATANLALFGALARGRISVVSPIVSAYPAFVIAFTVIGGSRPSLLAWAAMAGVMAGVFIVARAVQEEEGAAPARRKDAIIVVGMSMLASLSFAVALIAGQAATPIFGEAQTVWYSRIFTVATIIPVLLFIQPRPVELPVRWWTAFTAMGLLDVLSLVVLYAAARTAAPEIAAVTSSGFGAVTVLLGWAVLKERIAWRQWVGIVLIFACVGILTAGV